MKQLSYSAAEIDKRLGQVDKFSNDNLLINPFFQINQRGQSSYSGAGYTVDGWRLMSSGNSLSVSAAGVTLSGAGTAILRQVIENPSAYHGKTVTISAVVGGVLYQATGIMPNAVPSTLTTVAIHSFDAARYVALLYANTGEMYFQFRAGDGGTLSDISAAKLELGSISTLANDAPPKIATDLAECQRYFRVWKTEAARTAALNEVGLMRLESPTLGTIVIGGTTYYTASAEL